MSSPAALREGYEHFDPRAYLRNNYLPPRADFSSEEFVVPWKLRCLAETFASGEGKAAGIRVGRGKWAGIPHGLRWEGVKGQESHMERGWAGIPCVDSCRNP